MRWPRLRLSVRALMILVVLSALVAPYARPARRRWVFCWGVARKHTLREGYYRGRMAVYNKPPTQDDLRMADYCVRQKWKYRWAAFRFWEPFELIETEFDR